MHSPGLDQRRTVFLLSERDPGQWPACRNPTAGPPATHTHTHTHTHTREQQAQITTELTNRSVWETHVFDVVGGDQLAVFVDGSFCDDHDVQTRAFTAALQNHTHTHTHTHSFIHRVKSFLQPKMWPWTTKSVIRVNFSKLRFIHHLEAE